MNKQERASVIRKLKPATWYAFCQMESMNPKEVRITKNDLMEQLCIGSLPTLNKYLEAMESYGLIRQIQGGFIIAQMDGQPSGITEDPVKRKFKNARDIIMLWSECYENKYGKPYIIISNNSSISTKVRGFLRFSDGEIQGTIKAIFNMYDDTWASQKYPRPTLGAMCNWLFQQALPYAMDYPNEALAEKL